MMKIRSNQRTQHGLSMLEVLISIAILSIGLLGLAGLQSRLQLSEMESYQRAQALILLDDMVSRITLNRKNAISYVTGVAAPTGVGVNCPADISSIVNKDIKEWCESLQGASETQGTDKVGAFIGGRGCIEDLGSNEYRVTVAWQGLAPVSAPPAKIACGENLYDGGACTKNLCRRVITATVGIANLK